MRSWGFYALREELKIGETVFFILFFMFALNASAKEAERGLQYKIILTNSLEKKVPVDEFRCEEKIFLYFTWFGLKGSHDLKVLWLKPGRRLQETTEYSFISKNQKELNTWLWLKLEKKGREKGIFSSDFVWFDFIGQWDVEIFLDEELLEKKNFKVLC